MKKLSKILTCWIPYKPWRKKCKIFCEDFFYNMIPLHKDWVVFYDTFSKNGNGDSIRPLAEELRKRQPEFKFFFVSEGHKEIDMADEVLIKGSERCEYVINRAKYLLSPMDLPLKKHKGQIWIVTWHGTPYKKIYLSREPDNIDFKNYVQKFQLADYFCVQSTTGKSYVTEGIGIEPNKCIHTGMPRNDILFHHSDEFISDLKRKLKLPPNKKVLLYCPTWRRYDFKSVLPFDLNKLKSKIGKDYVILIRSHVGKQQWVDDQDNPINIFDQEFSFNGGEYPEITHLFLITDILINDYSSAVFDFSITQKPQIFYAYDLDEYEKKFQFYEDYRGFIPGDLCKTTEELISAVLDVDNYYKKYGEKYAKLRDKYCEFENGTGTKQVIDILEKGTNR